MKVYNVKYIQGHLIDTNTNQRIILKQGSMYSINGEENSFSFEDSRLEKSIVLNSEQKSDSIKKSHKNTETVKILIKDTELLFRIGNSKTIREGESKEYVFSAKLLEDLYIYKTSKGDRKRIESWRLAECQCQLLACVFGNLPMYQDLFASSLNKLFAHTVQFYFPFQRSTATNAFNTFVLYDKRKSVQTNSKLIGFERLEVVREKELKIHVE